MTSPGLADVRPASHEPGRGRRRRHHRLPRVCLDRAIYPLAILSALAIHLAFSRTAASVRSAAGWAVVTVMTVTVVQPAINVPRSVPVVSLDLDNAGRWMRTNVGPGCADYLVGSANTAYWLHLAVLGNPRAAARTAEIDRFDSRQVIGEWVASRGRGYAIADLGLLPDEVRRNAQVVAEFGRAAVIHRDGAQCSAPCSLLPAYSL